MKYRVQVTPDCIARGRRSDPYCCPVALGVYDSTGLSCRIDQRRLTIVFDDGEVRKVAVPKAIAERIHAWDSRYEMEPFAFELDLGAEPGAEKMTLV